MSFSNFDLIYALGIFFATFCSDCFAARILSVWRDREKETCLTYQLSNARFFFEVFLRTGIYVTVQREFRKAFPDRESPSKSTIRYNVTKYREHGTSLNRHKDNSGRRITVRTPESLEIVRQRVEENLRNISTRRYGLDFSRTTLRRILKKDLDMHLYQIYVRHELF